MDPNTPQSTQHDGQTMPLPKQPAPKQDSNEPNPAADLVRKKVEAAYAGEPDAATGAVDAAELGNSIKRSSHQDFIYNLTNSGKALSEIQNAWHEYYAGLPDEQKHEVWQEFYAAHAQASHYAPAQPALSPQSLSYEEIPMNAPSTAQLSPRPQKALYRTLADLRDYAFGAVNNRAKLNPMQHFQSLLFGLGVGSVVILIFMFSFFNERFIAPLIQPSRNVSNTPIIASSEASGPNPEVIIPKINVEIPVVYDISTIDEATVETGLERGVVHYADTAVPGEDGNVVIVGHSSNNIFNPGKYKFAFVLLSRLEDGDLFYLQKGGKRYTYEVYEKKIVKPTDVGVLATKDKQATATLITCDPPGTSINRLVVIGEQINPSPSKNSAQVANNTLATKTAVIPGNSPSLWHRLTGWISD
jgi:sortase A